MKKARQRLGRIMSRERASGSYIFYMFLLVEEAFDKLLSTFNIQSTLKDARGITKVQDTSCPRFGDVTQFVKGSQASGAQGSAHVKQRQEKQSKDYKNQAV